MRTFLYVLAGLVAALVLGIAGLAAAARFADGPIAIFPGGPFTSGRAYEGPEPDWSFVHDIPEVEFQLMDPPRSRITWIMDHDGKAYIASGYMQTWYGKLWKQWPHELERDPRILLRVGDRIYPRRMLRIQSGPVVAPVLAEASRKYLGGQDLPEDVVTSGSLWLYELAPPE